MRTKKKHLSSIDSDGHVEHTAIQQRAISVCFDSIWNNDGV